ncbi:SGNH/GDSL hydrolase family protein [candidate division KSB1 bacterium]
MKLYKFTILAVLSVFIVFSCAKNDDLITRPAGDTGDADFSTYVALGNSLTAGVQAGNIMQEFQMNSYPNLIARQAGVSSFEQPLIGYPGLGTGLMELTAVSPLTIAISDPTGTPLNLTLARPYNNLGIPGITSYDLFNAFNATTNFSYTYTGSGENPLIDLILRNTSADPAVALTAVEAAIALQPTFITIWIGANDVLGAAVYGSITKLIPSEMLQLNLAGTIATIQAALPNTKIVLANIPDVGAIPYVNTLEPYIPDPTTGASSPYLYLGVSANDKVLLSAIAYAEAGYGIPAALGGLDLPLPDAAFLTSAELSAISSHVNTLNSIISTIAAQYDIPVVDANGIFSDIDSDGLYYAGQELTTDFITGGIFSLDGVHPTSKGYGIIANEFIKTINAEFNASIPLVDLNALPGVPLPSIGKISNEKLNLYEIIRNNKDVFSNIKKLF